MAAHIFPNSIFIEGFPSDMSPFNFLSIFGGFKGHINVIEIINTDGEPKAFIQYEYADSLPLALEMKGSHLFNHPSPLNVQVVDERVLCDHVPGEKYDVREALANLKHVLFRVLASQEQRLAMIDELKESYERYKAQKKEEERDMDANLLRTIAHLETITDRCNQLEAGNRVLQDRVEEAEALEREATSKLTLVSAQLETTTDRCAKLEAGNRAVQDRMKEAEEFARESASKSRLVAGQLHHITCRCAKLETDLGVLGTKLADVVDCEPKVERQPSDSELNKKVDGLRRELEEATAQKERTIENLGLANNAVMRLQEELRTTQKAVDVSQSSLSRAKSAVGDMDSRVRALQGYVTDTQTKRRRAEEELGEEREAKRRLKEERDSIETRWRVKADEAAQYQAERQQLKARLQTERRERKRAEESVAEANAKLDKVAITDSLTAVFVKFDQILLRVVKEAYPAEDSSTSR